MIAYALSAIDLLPDVIPILGYLDDLVLIPLGIYLAINLIPRKIWLECQAQAAARTINLRRSAKAPVVIVIVRMAAILLTAIVFVDLFRRG